MIKCSITYRTITGPNYHNLIPTGRWKVIEYADKECSLFIEVEFPYKLKDVQRHISSSWTDTIQFVPENYLIVKWQKEYPIQECNNDQRSNYP